MRTEDYESTTLLSIVEITNPPRLDGKTRILFRHNEDYFLVVLSRDETAFLKRKIDSITTLFDSHLERLTSQEPKGK